MKKFNRIFWPLLIFFGLLGPFSSYFIGLVNPHYVSSDLADSLIYLIPIGVIGSTYSIVSRYGLERSLPLFIAWGLFLIFVIALYADINAADQKAPGAQGFESFAWLPPIYVAFTVGIIMIAVYSIRSPKQLR